LILLHNNVDQLQSSAILVDECRKLRTCHDRRFEHFSKKSIAFRALRFLRMSTIDLDDILDQALDDFAEQELNDQLSAAERDGKEEDPLGKEIEAQSERQRNGAQMEQLMSSMNDPKYGKSLQSTLKSLSSTAGGVESVDHLFDELAKQFETNLRPTHMPTNPDNDEEILHADREVAATLQMMSSAQEGMEGFEAGKIEETGEQMMEEMMAQFESLGEKEDYNEV
jgi:hypothetical protein